MFVPGKYYPKQWAFSIAMLCYTGVYECSFHPILGRIWFVPSDAAAAKGRKVRIYTPGNLMNRYSTQNDDLETMYLSPSTGSIATKTWAIRFPQKGTSRNQQLVLLFHLKTSSHFRTWKLDGWIRRLLSFWGKRPTPQKSNIDT